MKVIKKSSQALATSPKGSAGCYLLLWVPSAKHSLCRLCRSQDHRITAPVRSLSRGLRPSASSTSTCTSPPPPRASSRALRSGSATMRMGQSSSSSAASSSLSSPPLHRRATTLHARRGDVHVSVSSSCNWGGGGADFVCHQPSVTCVCFAVTEQMHADILGHRRTDS